MSNEVHAHMFGRKRHGDREEVKMALYNPDGTPFIPGSTVTGVVRSGPGGPNQPGPLAPAGSDDFSVDHRGDPAWWSIVPAPAPDSSVSGGTLNAGSGSGTMLFMVPPPGLLGRATLSVKLTDPTAVVEFYICANQILEQKLGGILKRTTLDSVGMTVGAFLDGFTKTFTGTPLALDHLYTIQVTCDANGVGKISVYDGPVSATPLHTLGFNVSSYLSYFTDAPGRMAIKGHHFVAEDVLYEALSPPVPIGQNEDFYVDRTSGEIYGPKAGDAWDTPINGPGLGTRPVDVYDNIDMSPTRPYYTVDCAGKTVVHVRRLLINSATTNKDVTVYLDNIKPGTPYHITVNNGSAFAHRVTLEGNSSGSLIGDIITAGQGRSPNLLLGPGDSCSFISMFTSAGDRPLAVSTGQPSSPRRDVTANYTCTGYDVNGLIVVNSASPVTITTRNQASGEWWKGEELEVYQAGGGPVTIAPYAGDTLLRPGGLTGSFVMPGGQYSTVKLRLMALTQWAVVETTGLAAPI
jgi:hypothetical protein